MRVAIVGLPSVGKTSLFDALSLGEHKSQGSYQVKVVKVQDPRLEKLAKLYNPKKVVHSTLEFVDTPSIDPKAPQKEKIRTFSAFSKAEALVLVLRAFENFSVPFPEGCFDPKSQLDRLLEEFIFRDLEICENRIHRLQNAKRKLEAHEVGELEMLERLKNYLEDMVPLNKVELTEEERKKLSGFNFCSLLPFVVALNTSEQGLKLEESVETFGDYPMVKFCGALERDLAELSEKERSSFMEAYGVKEPVVQRLTRVIYRHMGLITFFTVSEKEVHAWTVEENASALEAAGKIHSDMARGFIKAEIMKFKDLVEYGSERILREHGLVRVVGKDHPVEDGDILKVRFNV